MRALVLFGVVVGQETGSVTSELREVEAEGFFGEITHAIITFLAHYRWPAAPRPRV